MDKAGYIYVICIYLFILYISGYVYNIYITIITKEKEAMSLKRSRVERLTQAELEEEMVINIVLTCAILKE